MDWIDLGQNRDSWRAVYFKHSNEILGCINAGNFLTT
jgi:hypothetical protein